MAIDWVIVGGLSCGALAGGAARFGRLCTMSAVEDALVGRDYRGAKAWGLAIAGSVLATQVLGWLGWVDLARSPYAASQLHVLGTVLGGFLFGLGMTFVGTCSFGLLVRAGGGDLRAAVSAMIVGIVAIAATAGALSAGREALLSVGSVNFAAYGGSSIDGLLGNVVGTRGAQAMLACVLALLIIAPLADRRLRNRRRLLIGSVLMGMAIVAGWLATSFAVDALALDRPESLSFVAPVGRALLQFMMEPFRNIGFGVSAAAGALGASLIIAVWRREFRWEAFDDAIEMRRHLLGAALMGMGGILAQGCTIGQGLSAASTLAISAPIFIASVLVGAKLGLAYLIEGRAMWRLGRP